MMNTRRSFLKMAGATLLAGSGRFKAEAQVLDVRPPTVDTSDPIEVADGVWIIRDHRIWLVPNIGIIVGRDAALVIDTGLGPANGAHVLALAHKLAGSKKLYLTVTHFHPEHGYGAQVFEKQTTIVYNSAQRDELQEKGVRYIELFKQTQSKAAVMALEDTRIVMPHFVYDGQMAELDLGGRKVEFHNVGLAHTRGDQVVVLPKEQILFAGDLIEERMFPIFPYFPPLDAELDGARWSSALGDFKRFSPKLIIPGHGDPGSLTIASNLKSQMDQVQQAVAALHAAGFTADQMIAQCKPKIINAFPDWQHPELLDLQTRYNASLLS
jgi:glyoxylase-like metal-dependent hydrolase (beta-lactamase superfamily II)